MATNAERNQGAGAFSTPGVDVGTRGGAPPFITAQQAVSFSLHDVPPPSLLFIGPGDRIALLGFNSDPGVTSVVFTARILLAADGKMSFNQWTIQVPSNRTAVNQSFDIPEGYLLSIQAVGGSGTTRGRCFVQAAIVRGPQGNNIGYYNLISDYLSRGHNPSWPVGEYVSSVESAGATRVFAGTTPAAGAEISETVPTGARWRFKSFRFRLVTSATVINRTVRLALDDGVNTYFLGSFNFLQAAGVTADYSVGINCAQISDAGTNTFSGPIPENLLFAASRIRTASNNLQAGDQFSQLAYLVEEWIEV